MLLEIAKERIADVSFGGGISSTNEISRKTNTISETEEKISTKNSQICYGLPATRFGLLPENITDPVEKG